MGSGCARPHIVSHWGVMPTPRPGEFLLLTGAFRGKWVRYRAMVREEKKHPAECWRCRARTGDAGAAGWYYSRAISRAGHQLCPPCADAVAA